MGKQQGFFYHMGKLFFLHETFNGRSELTPKNNLPQKKLLLWEDKEKNSIIAEKYNKHIQNSKDGFSALSRVIEYSCSRCGLDGICACGTISGGRDNQPKSQHCVIAP
jgi:hypothetical protein